jgi:Fe-S oxidoreductase
MPIENVILTTENCRYCLMCRHVCPVGHVTRSETLSPHGWGLTIASVQRGLLDWNNDTVAVLYSCADCGTCRAHCVTDQPLPQAIAAARAEVAAQDLAPEIVYQINQSLQEWGNPYQKEIQNSFKESGEVALFVGDDAHFLRPSALEAALKLLSATGVEPVLIGVGRNNGYLASSLGFPETAKRLAQTNLDELHASSAGRLLVLTPGDYFTFSRLYDERLGLPLPDHIELQEVLVHLEIQLQAGNLAFSHADEQEAYAYLDPTHSVRVKTRYDAPRKLLQAVMPHPPSELFWRRERTHPAGNVALRYTNPRIADHLTYARLEDARSNGIRLVICEDPGTLKEIEGKAEMFGIEVSGLYELLAQHLKG